jgi:hypothetical protein
VFTRARKVIGYLQRRTAPGMCPKFTPVAPPCHAQISTESGMLVFDHAVILCVQEYLNLQLQIIVRYGYEVSRAHASPDAPDFPTASEYCRATYPYKERLYWYDSFPHPNDPSLVSTHPHHKHVPPDIKHHRIPAPDLSFTRPNLPFLIGEIERQVLQQPDA